MLWRAPSIHHFKNLIIGGSFVVYADQCGTSQHFSVLIRSLHCVYLTRNPKSFNILRTWLLVDLLFPCCGCHRLLLLLSFDCSGQLAPRFLWSQFNQLSFPSIFFHIHLDYYPHFLKYRNFSPHGTRTNCSKIMQYPPQSPPRSQTFKNKFLSMALINQFNSCSFFWFIVFYLSYDLFSQTLLRLLHDFLDSSRPIRSHRRRLHPSCLPLHCLERDILLLNRAQSLEILFSLLQSPSQEYFYFLPTVLVCSIPGSYTDYCCYGLRCWQVPRTCR